MSFIEQLQQAWRDNRSMLCVGLDPEPSRFPQELRETPDAVFVFCKTIVDATADLVCCFKPQFAHFAALRAEEALERLIAHIHEQHPGVPVILDTKRGDIGSTAQFYAAEAFDRYGADAVTVNPYLGRDSVQPFLDRSDRGVVVLCRTSNPGARDLQDLMVPGPTGDAVPLYQHVARTVAHDWNEHGNCMLVVGATYPRELAEVRALVGNMPLLVPGIGAQGGDVAAVVQNGRDARGQGLVISSSRSILYASRASDFAAQARNSAAQLRAQITESLLM